MRLTSSIWFQLFGLLGLTLAIILMAFDGRRISPAGRRLLCGVIVALAVTAGLFAAAVYDMCKDPAYLDTWWWYAWGCWMN